MTIKREQRKIERSPKDQARIDAIRQKYDQNKPGPDQLTASGEYEGPIQASAYWEVRRVMARLKAERERQGLTLSQLAERSGIDKGAISKLETGRQVNPTIDTLSRLAAALGIKLGITLPLESDAPEPATKVDTVVLQAALDELVPQFRRQLLQAVSHPKRVNPRRDQSKKVKTG